ncbi:hypothetical protein [Nocardia sp. NPDC004711]
MNPFILDEDHVEFRDSVRRFARQKLMPGYLGRAQRDEYPYEEVEPKDRMLFIVAIEVLKCRAEGIVASDDLADIGSIFAGFPASTGGALHFAYSNHLGAQGFLARAAGPSATYDDRFDAQTLVKADALAN